MVSDKIPIGRFSMITRLTCKALRLYDETGLLTPAVKDRFTGYRYYHLSQIQRGVMIRSLIDLGFPLSVVGEVITAKESGNIERCRHLIRIQHQKVVSEMERLRMIGNLLQRQEKELFSMVLSEPKIKEIEPLRVISIRGKGTYEIIIPELIGRLCTYLGSSQTGNGPVSVTGPVITLYHDGEYKEIDADVEVAIPVTGRLLEQIQGMEVRTLPGGTFTSLIHKGRYHEVHESWGRLYEWTVNQGYNPKAPCRDQYLNDPGEVPEEELLTELLIPV